MENQEENLERMEGSKEDPFIKNQDNIRPLKPSLVERSSVAGGDSSEYFNDTKVKEEALLKAMMASDDPKEWKRMVGLRTMAELYRTLDKLSIRKEYHKALSFNGIDFKKIAKKLNQLCFESDKEAIQLKGLTLLLKSLGLDRYETVTDNDQGWEEIIAEASANIDKKKNAIEGEEVSIDPDEDYEVNLPAVPEEVVKNQEDENKLARELYK